VQVYYNGDKTGYVAAEYVTVQEEYISAKSIEEERAEEAARREREARERQEREQSENTAEDTTFVPTAPSGNYTTDSELRSAIVEYALQYVGNRYVHGGKSLTDGTDCSGFTCYIYRDFGYSISRTPSGQYSSAGRSISVEEALPGDIICYGSKSCSHVGLYIGDGQIVHEANSKKGCIVSDISYMNILGARNVID
jgi:cell wall-associated NlpC family hydrolase